MMELVLKVTALIALGGGVALALRWHSAAARHFVWVLAISSTLLLPLLAPIAPSVQVTMTRPAPAAVEVPSEPGPAPAPISVERTPGLSVAVDLPEEPQKTWPSLFAWLTTIWAIGCAVLLGRIVVGHIGLSRIARRSTPFGLQWQPLIRDAIEYTGSRRSVRVAYSAVVGGPLAWGWRRPVVLFPAEAESWPVERVRVALLHELAHIARFDHASQLISQVACAVYWFHPLLWIASRAMRTESEHACDDRVIEAGMPGPDYAELLLEVARCVRAPRFYASAAVSMARSSHLEERLHAVLDDERSRQSVPAGVRAFGAAFLALLLIPIAGLTTKVVSAPVLEPLIAPVVAPILDPDPDPNPDPDGTWVRELAVGSNQELRLHNAGHADVRISGWDEPRVRVELEGVGDHRNRGGIEVERTRYGARVSLDGSSPVRKIMVHVPRRFDIRPQLGSGAVIISGVEGRFNGNSGGGDIILTKVSGRAALNTGGGEITVSDSRLDGWVNTGGGGVRVVRVQGNLRANSGGGNVIYQDTDIAPLRVDHDGGDVRFDSVPHGGKVSTGGGNIRIGRTEGRLEAETGGGNIDVGPVAGSLRASTGAGNVNVVVDGGGEEQRIEVTNGTGNVHIDLPDDFEGTLDLAADGVPGAAQIESTFPLKILKDGGSVRARGAIGSGSNVVVVRTNNGKIDIR